MYFRLIFILWVVFYVCFSLAVTFSKLSFDKQKFPTNDPNSLVEVQLAFQTKYSEVVFNMPSCFTFIRYRKRHLKRRFRYGSNHPGSYNPTLITNQEAHMVNGNMDRQGTEGSTKKQKNRKSSTKGTMEISNYFSKATVASNGK